MKNIFLLGASGSIGQQSLTIIRKNQEYSLKAISVGYNIEAAITIIHEFKPELVSVASLQEKEQLQKKFPEIIFSCGEQGLIDVATYGDQ